MQKALKKAFEEFINKDNRVSKLLAKFVNDVLKRGSKVSRCSTRAHTPLPLYARSQHPVWRSLTDAGARCCAAAAVCR